MTSQRLLVIVKVQPEAIQDTVFYGLLRASVPHSLQ
jgi:hypothetical protein